MGAEVVPFPLARRIDLIHRQAEYALALKPLKAEQHIARQLDTQRQVLRRRGVVEATIEREVRSMEAAIRAAMWIATFDQPGGVV